MLTLALLWAAVLLLACVLQYAANRYSAPERTAGPETAMHDPLRVDPEAWAAFLTEEIANLPEIEHPEPGR